MEMEKLKHNNNMDRENVEITIESRNNFIKKNQPKHKLF